MRSGYLLVIGLRKRELLSIKNKDSFVTTYATVNPFEDIAEFFSCFMLTPSNASPQTVAESKVNFFYQFPELKDGLLYPIFKLSCPESQ